MLIIKGAIYTDGENLLRPHFSGEFNMVDCTEYKTKTQMEEAYDDRYIEEFMNGLCLEYKGEKYYECEFSPYYTKGLELLSDICDTSFYDNETSF